MCHILWSTLPWKQRWGLVWDEDIVGRHGHWETLWPILPCYSAGTRSEPWGKSTSGCGVRLLQCEMNRVHNLRRRRRRNSWLEYFVHLFRHDLFARICISSAEIFLDAGVTIRWCILTAPSGTCVEQVSISSSLKRERRRYWLLFKQLACLMLASFNGEGDLPLASLIIQPTFVGSEERFRVLEVLVGSMSSSSICNMQEHFQGSVQLLVVLTSLSFARLSFAGCLWGAEHI